MGAVRVTFDGHESLDRQVRLARRQARPSAQVRWNEGISVGYACGGILAEEVLCAVEGLLNGGC